MDCLEEEIVLAFTEGLLSGEQLAAVHHHLDGCRRCRGLLADFAMLGASREADRSQSEAAAEPWPVLQPGDRVGRYQIVGALGQGGGGAVYEGRDPEIDSRVAIKLLRPSGRGGADQRKLAMAEARAANRVHHPGLVKVIALGELADHVPYLVMEYLDGELLAALLHRRPQRERLHDLPLLRQVAETMAALHGQGVLHRDLKPANLLVIRDSAVPGGRRVKILDFGLARLHSYEGGDGHSRGGALAGTPRYMAPEQCQGHSELTTAVDVYALGVVLYELCAGRPPFSASSVAELCALHLRAAPPALAASVPKALRLLAAQMLAKAPDARPSMAEVARALAAVPPLTAPPSQWFIGVLRWLALLPLALLPGAGLAPRVTAPKAPEAQPAPAQATRRCASPTAQWLAPRHLPVRDVPRSPQSLIPGGTFLMGSSDKEIGRAMRECQAIPGAACERGLFTREGPQRPVTVSSFLMDTIEVTYGQFAEWLNTLIESGGLCLERHIVSDAAVPLLNMYVTLEPSFGLILRDGHFQAFPGFSDMPIDQVSWFAAHRFCQDVGRRLPSEAEWEFAARGRAGRRYPFGDHLSGCSDAVYARCFPRAGDNECPTLCAHLGTGPAAAAATRDRTPERIFGMAGNVSEWVADAFWPRYPTCPSGGCVNPLLSVGPPDQPLRRVIRGSGWAWSSITLRAASRSRYAPDAIVRNIGFRCVTPIQPGHHPIGSHHAQATP